MSDEFFINKEYTTTQDVVKVINTLKEMQGILRDAYYHLMNLAGSIECDFDLPDHFASIRKKIDDAIDYSNAFLVDKITEENKE